MESNHFGNEPLPELKFDKNRKGVKHCPCGLENNTHFVPYIGYDDKGFCHTCDKTFLPELVKSEQSNNSFQKPYIKQLIKLKPPIDIIPFETYLNLLNSGKHLYSQNNFILWLGNSKRGNSAFDTKTIESLIETYFLGNSLEYKYKGWVLFPYIDIGGRIRDIKAIDYNPQTGKRIKEPNNKCWFIGKELLNNKEANTERCFYAENLLKGNAKPVMIFESEATATHAAAFYPDSICIATGGKNGCKWTKEDIFKVLKGRQITIYPDIDAHEDWEQNAKILRNHGLNVSVSQLIKTSALKYSEQSGIEYDELVKQKYDLRDFLQSKDLGDIIKPILTQPQPFEPDYEYLDYDEPDFIDITANEECEKVKLHKKEPENWNTKIEELENYFKTVTIPDYPVKLNPCGTIINISSFIESHIRTLKFYNGNKTFLPYLNRLLQLKQLI